MTDKQYIYVIKAFIPAVVLELALYLIFFT